MPAPSVYTGVVCPVNSDPRSSAPFHGHAEILTGTLPPPLMPAELDFGRLQNGFGLFAHLNPADNAAIERRRSISRHPSSVCDLSPLQRWLPPLLSCQRPEPEEGY